MKLLRIIRLVVLGAGVIYAYLRLVRPHVLDGGSTPEEAIAALPGDDILAHTAIQTTRAISIDASTEVTWKWLVQMGPRPRGGVYTYDWIERVLGLDIENADRILPEYQHMDVGSKWSLSKKGKGPVLDVMAVQAPSHIVLQWEPAAATWAFVLWPHGRTTRLLSRNRIPGSGIAFRLAYLIMEPLSLVMEREMLLGIKRRAERLAREEAAAP